MSRRCLQYWYLWDLIWCSSWRAVSQEWVWILLLLYLFNSSYIFKFEDIKERIEYTNYENIAVKRVTSLRRHARNPNTTTQSIIIFTECLKEADEGILNRMNIEHRHHAVKRYIPQCQIKQYFNCQVCEPKANVCPRKTRCGKRKIITQIKCKSEIVQSGNFNGAHTAWYHQSPWCQIESEQKEALKDGF